MTDATGIPVWAENQHHDYVNAESARIAVVAALDQWEKANCDCCAPSMLDEAIDRIGYEVSFWERLRHFGIDLAQTAQNVIDGELANFEDK
jgi:hypothetical protein